MIKIAPSLLSADFADLKNDIKTIESADYLHFDVMDGAFVPNMSIGIPVLEAVRRSTDMVLDVHLMIEKPMRMVESFAKAGADIIVIHLEADQPQNIIETLNRIKSLGVRAGISLKPKTPAEAVLPYVDMVSMILVMTVEPGFGGQSFMEEQMDKVAAIRRMINERNPECELEVDGGINAETARICVNAGANVLVAGSTVFKSRDREKTILELRG